MGTLAEFRTWLALDMGSGTVITNSEIDRAVQLAVADLSKFLPAEDWEDLPISDLDVEDEAWTSDAVDGVFVTLANSFIQPQSESVSLASDGTAYRRGTDYEMDYVDGSIAVLAAGDMAASTAHLITYKKNRHSVDISGLTYISIVKVEVRAGNQVEMQPAFEIHEDRLIFLTDGERTQNWLPENTNVWIQYTKAQTPPTVSVIGSYPVILDAIVTRGAMAHLWMMQAGVRNFQGLTDRASARTEFGNTTTIHTAIAALHVLITSVHTAMDTLHTSAATEHTATNTIHTAMAAVHVLVTGVGAVKEDIETDLAAASTSFALAVTEMASLLVSFTALTAIAKTDMDTALTAATASLGRAATAITTISSVAATTEVGRIDTQGLAAKVALDISATESLLSNAALDKVTVILTTDLDAAWTSLNTAWNDVSNHLDGDAGGVDADAYLGAGDALLNAVNLGADAPRNYVEYAQTAIALAAAYNERLEHWLEEAGNITEKAQTFIQEGIARSQGALASVQEAAEFVRAGSMYVGATQMRLGIENLAAIEADNEVDNAGVYAQMGRVEADYAQAIADNNRAIADNNSFLIDEARVESLAIVENHVAIATQQVASAAARVGLFSQLMEELSQYNQQLTAYHDQINTYVGQLASKNQELANYNQQIEAYQDQIGRYIAEGDRYTDLASEEIEAAEEARLLADDLRNEYFAILRERAGMVSANSEASPHQPHLPRS